MDGHILLTFEYNNIECAAGSVARAISEGVGHLRGSNTKECSWNVGPGRSWGGARVVDGSWLCPCDGCATNASADGSSDVVDACHGWWDSVG